MALGAQFWPNYWQAGIAEIVRLRVPFVLRTTLFELHVCGALLALVGLAALWRRAWRVAAVLLVLALAGGAFATHQFLVNPAGAYWVVYLCAAWCAGAGVDVLLGLAGRLRIGVLILWCLCLGVSVAATVTAWPWHQNKYDIEELLYALPDKADMLVLDQYSWNEVFKYYQATHPYLRRRVVRAVTSVPALRTAPLLYFDHDIARQLRATGMAGVPLWSNDWQTLHVMYDAEQAE